MHHAGHLTTHSTELSFVGGWHGNIGTVVTIKAHYQAEGCFQRNKFATIEDFNSIDRFDRWGHNFAIYLKTDKRLLVGKGSKDEKTHFLHILRCHEKKSSPSGQTWTVRPLPRTTETPFTVTRTAFT